MRLRFYSWVYRWALKRARLSSSNNELRNKHPKISNHALLRYAERFDGYDFDKAVETLLSDEAKKLIWEYGGNGKFTCNGILYTVKDGHILTVVRPGNEIKRAMIYQPLNKEKGRKWSF